MKITLENFGPIHRVEFDLSKDLNVIFGKNNIGKSYAITALYILLKHLLAEFGGDNEHHLQRLYRGRSLFNGNGGNDFAAEAPDSPSPVAVFVRAVLAELNASAAPAEVDVAPALAALLHNVFGVLAPTLSNAFNNSFQSVAQLANAAATGPLALTIAGEELTLCFRAQANQVVLHEVTLRGGFVAQKNPVRPSTSLKKQGTILYVNPDSDDQGNDRATTDAALGLVDRLLSNFRQELRGVAHAVYFLPASRSGLYQGLNNISSLLADLSKSRSFTTKGFNLPSLSEPVADYFLQLSNINPSVAPGGAAAIAREIEQEIIGGEIAFNDQTKKLYFRSQTATTELDLSFASSMVAEIAPIVAYCKYILQWKRYAVVTTGATPTEQFESSPSLIFIEEPEAHLHPAVQVKLLAFFARLTKHNVKVVMTSHSNYMFNKLSNLLLTDELEPEKVGSYLMRATPEGSVMDATAMRAEEEGIVDENFVDVAEQLYNERLEAYDKQGAKA